MTYEAYSLQESASNACCSIQTYHLYPQIPNDLIELDIVELADSLLGFLPLSNLSRRYNKKKVPPRKKRKKLISENSPLTIEKRTKKNIHSVFLVFHLRTYRGRDIERKEGEGKSTQHQVINILKENL